MRWLVGWNGTGVGAEPRLRDLRPLGGRLLWPGPDPLWAVGDWRPEEIRTVRVYRQHRATADAVGTGFPDLPEDPEDPSAADGAAARLAVVGRCGADDSALRAALLRASGGALRHLTAWPGSYTVVLQQGSRTTLLGDLVGVRPVFHTPWCGGTAYATAALPLADLVGARPDPLYLAAGLAVPDAPEIVAGHSAFTGVHRVAPARALSIRAGRPQEHAFEPYRPGVGGGTPPDRAGAAEATATGEVTRSLLEAVRSRVRSGGDQPRRISTDLSGGSASTVLTLLAAAVPRPVSGPPRPGSDTGAHPGAHPRHLPVPVQSVDERWGDPRSSRTLHHGPPSTAPATEPARTGAVRGSWARTGSAAGAADGQPLLVVTWTDSSTATGPAAPDPAHTAELVRAQALGSADARLEHLLVAGGPETLPYADLLAPDLAGPLTDEPGAALVAGARHRGRLAAAGTDHLGGHGGRQALDGHPARLADLLIEHQRFPLLRPITALARADSGEHPLQGAFGTPISVLRAARRLARTGYAEGLEDAATQLMARRRRVPTTAGSASVQSLTWCDPSPAARWLTDDALSAVAVRLRLATRRTAPDERPGERRARLALQRQAAEFRVLAQVAEDGQRLHAPFLDNQVVRACGLVPASARIQPGSRHAILRAVLAGAGVTALPAGWGASAPPDPYTAVATVRAGLRHALPALDRMFAAPLLADLGLLDARVFRRALHAAAGDRPVPLDGLAAVVSTELWLRRLHARQGSCWTGLPLAERRAIGARAPGDGGGGGGWDGPGDGSAGGSGADGGGGAADRNRDGDPGREAGRDPIGVP
ncbi:asparagine synthase-related protein [Streptacidiphilus cavernicola]|uniref:Asparagine synthase-related protein n=1 Tax=Streptacidiphilus cavernicola TaxID=3342716 RepID=A0ABV6VXQ0_9ACTN